MVTRKVTNETIHHPHILFMPLIHISITTLSLLDRTRLSLATKLKDIDAVLVRHIRYVIYADFSKKKYEVYHRIKYQYSGHVV